MKKSKTHSNTQLSKDSDNSIFGIEGIWQSVKNIFTNGVNAENNHKSELRNQKQNQSTSIMIFDTSEQIQYQDFDCETKNVEIKQQCQKRNPIIQKEQCQKNKKGQLRVTIKQLSEEGKKEQTSENQRQVQQNPEISKKVPQARNKVQPSEEKKNEQPQEAKKNDPSEAKKNVSQQGKKNETSKGQKNEPKEAQKSQPEVAKKNKLQEANKYESLQGKKNEPLEAKKIQPQVVKKNQPSDSKDNEPQVAKKNQPQVAKNNELQVVKKPSEVKKNQSSEAKKNQPQMVQKNEPSQAKKNEPSETKKNEPSETKKNEPSEAKKNEPQMVQKNEPSQAKKNEPQMVQKNEPSEAKKNDPSEAKNNYPQVTKKNQHLSLQTKNNDLLQGKKVEQLQKVKKDQPLQAKKEQSLDIKKQQKKVTKKEKIPNPQIDLLTTDEQQQSLRQGTQPHSQSNPMRLCKICEEHQSPSLKFIKFGKCHHFFCQSCLKGYFQFTINGDQFEFVKIIKCPEENCKQYFNKKDCQILKYLNTSVKEKYQKIIDAIKDGPIHFCTQCTDPPGVLDITQEPIKCRRCHNVFLHQEIFPNLYKVCPKCGIPIQRTIGCDHMVCGQKTSQGCGYNFCYKCLRPSGQRGNGLCGVYCAYQKRQNTSQTNMQRNAQPNMRRNIQPQNLNERFRFQIFNTLRENYFYLRLFLAILFSPVFLILFTFWTYYQFYKHQERKIIRVLWIVLTPISLIISFALAIYFYYGIVIKNMICPRR